MPIAAYLPKGIELPLIVQVKDKQYKLPNLNSLSWEKLSELYDLIRIDSQHWLAEEFWGDGYGFPWEVIWKLTGGQIEAFVERWFELAHTASKRLGQIIFVLERWDRDFSYDLRKLFGMDGVSDFLKLRLIDAADIFAIITEQETESWTWAKIHKYKYPLTRGDILGTDVYHALKQLSTAWGGKVDPEHNRLAKETDIYRELGITDEELDAELEDD